MIIASICRAKISSCYGECGEKTMFFVAYYDNAEDIMEVLPTMTGKF
ncbi:MAG: hypothetical protein PHH31_03700 [Acidaminococcaceae bacterium]|nr:hypothetical protein [Acidaminococcaceae bacterium]MDD4722052.1 hypothetical protein [Acidaminococcaceae bacterium]